MTQVTFLGTGMMTKGIATRLIAGGHDVTMVAFDEAEGRLRVSELPGARIVDEPGGDVVVLAVPYGAVESVVDRYRTQLAGRIVVDITNPVDFDVLTPLPVRGSAAQEIAAALPEAKVVKAFNTTFAPTLVAGVVGDVPLDVLIASDDDDAKRTVAGLVRDGGMRAVDAGPLARAHELEALGYLHISMQFLLGTQFGTGIKLLTAPLDHNLVP